MSVNAGMTLSDKGFQFIRDEESFSATKYRDANGFSIGYGHYILPGENFDNGITREQGEALLRNDVKKAEVPIKVFVTAKLNQNQYDALVSLTYNIGVAGFTGSTLKNKINTGASVVDISNAWRAWNKETKNGVKVVNNTLVRRRQKELDFYYTPVSSSATGAPVSDLKKKSL